MAVELEEKKANITQKIKEETAGRDLQVQYDAEAETKLNVEIKKGEVRAQNDRAIKAADYNLLKESFKDPIMRKLKTMSVVGDLHESMSFGGTNLRQMGDQEPVAMILDKFTVMVDDVVTPSGLGTR